MKTSCFYLALVLGVLAVGLASLENVDAAFALDLDEATCSDSSAGYSLSYGQTIFVAMRPYSNNVNLCLRIFLSSPGAYIHFYSVETEAGNDYMNIYDGLNSGKPLLKQVSGTSSPADVYVTQSAGIFFYFTSNNDVTSNGIQFAITAPETPSPTEKPTTGSPSTSPTTKSPTVSPTPKPTTISPTKSPTTESPTLSPTTMSPTLSPTTKTPTKSPTFSPTTKTPTVSPTPGPTTRTPSKSPTVSHCNALDINACNADSECIWFPIKGGASACRARDLVLVDCSQYLSITTCKTFGRPATYCVWNVATQKCLNRFTPNPTSDTAHPTASPTVKPTSKPTTGKPSRNPTNKPTKKPTRSPSKNPTTKAPTKFPTTPNPTTKAPTDANTPSPTKSPTSPCDKITSQTTCAANAICKWTQIKASTYACRSVDWGTSTMIDCGALKTITDCQKLNDGVSFCVWDKPNKTCKQRF